MKLRNGQRALNFTAHDIYGHEIQLSQYRGKKILLGFYRNVNCPFCNRRVHQIMGNNVNLKKQNIQLVFLFESSGETLKKSVFHQGISPWPLIGDLEKTIYKQYGVENSIVKWMKTMFYADYKEANKFAKEVGLPEEKDKDAGNMRIPADFLINEDFVIEKAHYGSHIDDHIDFEDFKRFANI